MVIANASAAMIAVHITKTILARLSDNFIMRPLFLPLFNQIPHFERLQQRKRVLQKSRWISFFRKPF